jgi:predicted nucleic acid-binding protein
LPDLICDTSAIQYLHQVGLLHILTSLAEEVIVPPAVINELNAGREAGINLPEENELSWVITRFPSGESALPLINDLGPGETEVLMLALEFTDSVAVIDDALARQVATVLQLQFTGTLGLLLDAKRAGLISAVAPILDQLHSLRFRLAPLTRNAVLKLAGERDK